MRLAIVPLAVALVGALVHLRADAASGKVAQLGLVAYAVGLLVTLLSLAHYAFPRT